ncbi:MAG: RES family NAD+ phosphorylase [Rhodospirillales bacterium]|nr:RES family NAD+ phosphorylase [Acetobacter sp.]
MRPAAELATALATVKLRSVHGPWSRCVGYRHLLAPPPGGVAGGLPQPLWGGAAKIAGARFTPKGGFDSLYLASDPVTALTEVSALVALPGGPVPVRAAPLVIVSVDGVVSRVLDLTDADTLAALGTNPQEITGTWVKVASPPTQTLAQAAYDSGPVAGIQYPSAKHPGGVNLVVFPDRLVAGPTDYLEAYDPQGLIAQRLSA